ncbi:hypothetical protein [Xanthocytophaga flava]|uniref:hypothetical protein n=1 Tax=Xanthocytophaga flava TaxID=3048013 RepID=UPI0028D5C7AF|nr:hypothetical protein [Xanthocytophaga flavus]MDJ1472863.1 hypothetical protein [Xanthocytophaga flavus]
MHLQNISTTPGQEQPNIQIKDLSASSVAYFNYKQIYSRLHTWITEHEQNQTYIKDTIRGNKIRTLEPILNKFLDQNKKYDPAQIQNFEDLPCLLTSRPELARLTKWKERTVYEHITKLVEIGILKKVFRGSNARFALWIHPWILTGLGPKPPLQTAKSETSPPYSGSVSPRKTCRTFKYNSTNSGVDSVDFPNKSGYLLTKHGEQPKIGSSLKNIDEQFLMNKEGQPETLDETMENIVEHPGGAGPADIYLSEVKEKWSQIDANDASEPENGQNSAQNIHSDQNIEDKEGQPVPAATPNARLTRQAKEAGTAASIREVNMQIYLSYVAIFWEYAKEKIYPHQYFSPDQERTFKQLIYKQVYSGFSAVWNPNRWEKYHNQVLEQIDIAAKFKSNYPDWVIASPTKYFNFSFTQGFVKTYEWWSDNQHSKHTHKVKDELRKARRSIQTGTIPGMKKKWFNPLELRSYWKDRISKLQDDQAMKSLDALFITYTQNSKQ